MTLHLHRGVRTDLLADELAELLRAPLPDPFAEEVVVVPAKGVERWLTQRLSHRLGTGPRGGDGVCAGVRFLNPRSLVSLLLDRERDDPWDPDRLVWPLLETIDAHLDDSWCRPLALHLGADREGAEQLLRRDRRWAVARRLAGLFAQYAVSRPSLVTDWREGRATDGAGAPLAPDLEWQQRLYAELVPRVGAPAPDLRHATALDAIRAGQPLALPDRLSLFGHTRLPVTEVELLAAVGEVREVHLWLPQPSPAQWDRLAPHVAGGPVRRRVDDTGLRVRHPLLSGLGRDSRELQRTLAPAGAADDTGAVEAPGSAEPADPAERLLGWLQADLHADEVPDMATRSARVLDAADRSVQLHSCHGPARQVEVLREVLVGLLQDDPTLEPRDILVMCPDVEAYAPLFSAAFGLAGVVEDGDGEVHPAHRLRVRLADRGLASTNPLLAVARTLLHLAGGRATATEVLDLASEEPVRRRFALDEDDLATVATWIEAAGVRWGLSVDLRAPYKVGWPQNTWRAGLDRLLLGVAMAEEQGRWLGDTLPVDDVASAAVDLVGRLAELVERVESCVVALGRAGTPAEWTSALAQGVHGLCATGPDEVWQAAQLDRELASVAESASQGGPGPELTLADLRALLDLRLRGRPTRANFRTGQLTVATLVPMRSVPHRVVALVGLDDGVFPRPGAQDGDDALGRDPLTGERDGRSEDRQLLLDALLAARDTLVVTWTGAHEQTGQERPPAVPLGELRDALDLTAVAADGVATHEAVTVRHPLQPFDPRNHEPGRLGLPSAFSFDRRTLAAARATSLDRDAVPALVAGPLPAQESPDVALADLKAFVAHPVRAFLRERLGISLPRAHEELPDAMPVQLDNLEQWAVGDRVLSRAIAGDQPDSVFESERLRGTLPPGALGAEVLDTVGRRVGELVQRSAAERVKPARTVDVLVDLAGGVRLTGSVPDVRGPRIVRVHFGGLSVKHRLAAWVDLLALSADDPDHSWTALTIGWHSRTRHPQVSLLGPVDHSAVDLLRDLVDLRRRGLREPLPLPLKTGAAFAEKARTGAPTDGARFLWDGRFGPEQAEPEHVRVHGPLAPYDVLLGPPAADETWNEQTTRLGQLAVRLWTPLLEHERIST